MVERRARCARLCAWFAPREVVCGKNFLVHWREADFEISTHVFASSRCDNLTAGVPEAYPGLGAEK